MNAEETFHQTRARVKYAAHTCKNIIAMNSVKLIILRLFKV